MKRQDNDWRNQEPPYKLSDAAVDWLIANGVPFATRDFIGYSMAVDDENGCAVGLDNQIYPFSLNPKKPVMTKRRIRKIVNTLIDSNFLKENSLDPFPEFERCNNIPFNLQNAILLDTYFKELPYLTDNKFKADDNFTWDIVDLREKILDNITIDNKGAVDCEKNICHK